jgi:pSer/pThr/pTyr-binding forkhead associated (FHA) protein
MPAPVQTKTDPALDQPVVDDLVFRLRHWSLPVGPPIPPEPGEYVIGSAPGCWLRLHDDKERVSRRHAVVIRERERVLIRDLGSKNKMKVDGVFQTEAVLEPCMKLWIGGVTLVAESSRSALLYGYLCRILGTRNAAPDIALVAMRAAGAKRAPLILSGNDDLVSLAQALHRRFMGADRPFVMCDPRRASAKRNARNPENHKLGMAALRAATQGTLCIWEDELPKDFAAVKAALVDPDSRVQLTVCTRETEKVFGATPIVVPPLRDRREDLPSIVDQYADDAMAELCLPRTRFADEDRTWVLAHEASTLATIEKAAVRLIALRVEQGNITRAAARLGVSRQSLRAWIDRRKLPMAVDDE